MLMARLGALALAAAMAAAMAAAIGATGPRVAAAQGPGDNVPFWSARPDAHAFDQLAAARLAAARRLRDRLLAVRGTRTLANTLEPYDQIQRALDFPAALVKEVHPDSAVRAAAERAVEQLSAFATELSLSRPVYEALRGLDLAGADPETRYYVTRTLRDFRLAGVDRDDTTRARVQALRDRLVALEQAFDRNIRDDVDTVEARPEELAGLPPDFVERHRPGADGLVRLTVDYPDVFPVLDYAANDDLRHRMQLAFDNRAYPQNLPVLDSILRVRYDLASLLGYANWADYISADKMIGSGRNASEFIDRVVAASGAAAERDYAVLLRRKQRDVPGATAVNLWERRYWSEVVRREDYDFDAQQVRAYFQYGRVRDGVLAVAGRIFGVTFRRAQHVPVWHPSVEAWEMLENGRLVGRFYLDMHPRPGKFNHAAMFTARRGMRGRLPEAALVCNLPGGDPGDPGLLEYDDVVTFFHEFGHLVHHLSSARHRWLGVSGIATEWDFVEAPSQLLEEWARDPATLASFARDDRTGEPIPAELVLRMNRANDFGKALNVRRQMVFARISLRLHDRPPAQVNSDSIVHQVYAAYVPFPAMADTHMQASFGHLTGYSAVYYTYMWSLVIAKDLFSAFDHSKLLEPGIARRYRETILAPGGAAPAATLVERFLGRPFRFDAWQAWLAEGTGSS